MNDVFECRSYRMFRSSFLMSDVADLSLFALNDGRFVLYSSQCSRSGLLFLDLHGSVLILFYVILS